MQNRIQKIVEILDEKKAEEIRVIHMGDDYFVRVVITATTLSERHALSLIDELKTKLKPLGEEFLNVESSDEWSVLDLGDILIHLLSQNYRQTYNIEELLESIKKREIN